jgi:hypothetical protein
VNKVYQAQEVEEASIYATKRLQEEGHFKGYKSKKIIPYKVPNKVGKIIKEVYIEHILPLIIDDLKDQGLSLCQDADSAHTSKLATDWIKANNLPFIILPGVSPNFSILESLAHPVKRAFHAVRFALNKAALARFNQVFMEELD